MKLTLDVVVSGGEVLGGGDDDGDSDGGDGDGDSDGGDGDGDSDGGDGGDGGDVGGSARTHRKVEDVVP